jgi:hypothetical protein
VIFWKNNSYDFGRDEKIQVSFSFIPQLQVDTDSFGRGGGHQLSCLSWLDIPSGPRPHCRGFEITLRHTTLGRTPLDEWSARRKDLYLTTHNTHKRQDIHAPGGIRIRSPSKRAAVDPRLRPRSHRDRPELYTAVRKTNGTICAARSGV